jgi:hypothetical protein
MKFRGIMLLLLGGLGAACGGVDDGAAENSAADAESEIVGQGLLIAKVALSTTHTVRFIEYPKLGISEVAETLDLDRDGLESSLRARGVAAGDPVDEIYAKIAGSQPDPTITSKLQDLRKRVEASRATSTDAPGGLDGAAPAISPPTAPSSAPSNGAEPVERTSQALCAEPKYDWSAEDKRFRGLYCHPSAQYCDFLDASHAAKARGKTGEYVFVNQSHCSNAQWEMKWRWADSCGLFSCPKKDRNVQRGTLAPRRVLTKYSSALGKDAGGDWPEHKSSITSDQGNFTGLSLFVYTQ